MTESRILIFDGNNWIIRSYFGTAKRNEFGGFETLKTSDGRESGALYSAITGFAALVRELKPTHVLWCFDSGKSTLRSQIRPEYKANREAGRDSDYRPTFSAFEEFLSVTGVRFVKERGVEADDIIAAATKKFFGEEMYVVSMDHDLLQLIEYKTYVYHPGTKKIITVSDILDKYKLHPGELPSLWALTGDPGDNIIGIKGVGEKTAYKMLSEFDFDLELVANNHPKVLQNNTPEYVMENLSLIKLSNDFSSLNVTLNECKFVPEMNSDLLAQWLESWEMTSLVNKVNRGTLWT